MPILMGLLLPNLTSGVCWEHLLRSAPIMCVTPVALSNPFHYVERPFHAEEP